MSWVDWVVAGVNTYMQSRSKDKDREADTKESFKWGARRDAFAMDLEQYYKRKEKAEMRRGAGEYAKFSSLSSWAPNYRNTFVADPVGDKPNPDNYQGDDDEDEDDD